jgi:hypothetical protein
MLILTEEMKRIVTEIQLCYAATVTPDGKPNLSPKGSITVLSDDEFEVANLASLGTIENLRHNPAIEQWRAPPGNSEGPKHLRHYGALGLCRECTRLHFRCRRDAGIARRRQLNLQNDRGLIGTIGQKRSIAMTHIGDHVPPRAWKWDAPNGGPFSGINRSTAGATHEREPPRGWHPPHRHQRDWGLN